MCGTAEIRAFQSQCIEMVLIPSLGNTDAFTSFLNVSVACFIGSFYRKHLLTEHESDA